MDQYLDERLRKLRSEMMDRGVPTTLMPDEEGGCLVCATKEFEDGSLGGNSVWLDLRGDNWHIGTWTPHRYRLPEDADIHEICRACLALQKSAIYTIPADVCERFGLVEVPPSA